MDVFTEKEYAIERVVERLKREVYEGEVTLRFRFFADFAAKNLKLVLEDPQECRVTLNGVPVDTSETGWYYSTSYRTAVLPDAVQIGENVLELTRYTKSQVMAPINDNMTHLFELFRAPVGVDMERVYILGGFHVEAVPEFPTGAGIVRTGRHLFLTPAKAQSAVYDLTSHGYPVYPGTVNYIAKAEVTTQMLEASDIRLCIGEYNACSAQVFVNGRKADSIDREPYTLSLKAWLKEGENEITVRLYNTPRNMIGPSHFEGQDVQGCSRNTWIDGYNNTDFTEYDVGTLTNSFQLTPYGIGGMTLEFQE